MDQNLPEPRMRASDAERDQILTVLQRGYETGRLDLAEMKERQERALGAIFVDELPLLIGDLPEGQGLAVRDTPLPAAAPSHDVMPETAPADAGFSVSVMSGRDLVVESGTRRLRNFAWWGGNTYDLTEAMGPGRIVTLTLDAVMAGSDIYVPEGVRVIDQSIAIMAGNEVAREAQGDGSNGTLVLKGFLWWAGNEVLPAGARRRGRRHR